MYTNNTAMLEQVVTGDYNEEKKKDHLHDHPCEMLSKNAKLRKYTEFSKECKFALKNNIKNLKKGEIDKEGIAFWSGVIDKMNIDEKQMEMKNNDNDVDEDDDKFDLEDFWNDLTTIDDKLVNFFDHKLLDYIDELLAKFFHALSLEISNGTGNLLIAADDIYDLIRDSIPILGDILKNTESPWNEVIPSEKGTFSNWGLTVNNTPSKIQNLYSKEDIISFINEAKTNNKKVRVMNYSHSFSPLFGDDDCYFGKLLDDKYSALQPEKIDQIYNDNLTETWVKDRPLMFVKLDLIKHRIIVGGSTPNSLYVNLIEKRLEKGLYKFPAEYANVIQVYQSWVGTHAVSCHGSGINTTNITAYITRLNIIDWEGKEVIYEGDILKKMSCHFGLFGIVHEMEIQCRPAYYLMYDPYTIKFEDYFPEKGECKLLQKDVNEASYNEFFWYPGQKEVYVSAFRETLDAENVRLHPYTNMLRELQQLAGSLNQMLYSLFPLNADNTSGIRGKILLKLFGRVIMFALPTPTDPVKIASCNGIHFSYGIQNMRVMNMEWSFPLHRLIDKQTGNDILYNNKTVPDVHIARDLFVECRKLINEYTDNTGANPCYLPLEMRIIRGCDVNLCFGKDVDFVCCIEILSIRADTSHNKIFDEFSQIVCDRWIEIIGENNKNDINYSRPHWGKYWQFLSVNNKSIYQHLKESYSDDFAEFNELRKKADPNNIFLNKTFGVLLGIYSEDEVFEDNKNISNQDGDKLIDIDIDKLNFKDMNDSEIKELDIKFSMPTKASLALKDTAWLSGRFWVTHISVLSRILHTPTSAGIAFSAYNTLLGLLLCLTAIIPGFDYIYGLYIGTAINGVIALLFIYHSAHSGLWQAVLVIIVYHGGIMVGGSYFLVPLYCFGNPTNLWFLWIVIPIFLSLFATFLQVWVVHKWVVGKWPTDSDPEWFPEFIDAMLRTFNGFFYIFMIFVYENQWFGVKKKYIDKARYCSKRFAGRQYSGFPCCSNPDDLKK